MKLIECPVGTRGVDTAARPNSNDCKLLKSKGFDFIVRYLPELDAQEIQTIHDAGLGLMLVAHVRLPGWKPTMAMGASDAERVSKRARDLSIPMGATIWCDLEGIASSEPGYDATTSTIAYEHAWAQMIRTWHFNPGNYIGAGVPLSDHELYARLLASSYWQSQSIVPTPAGRGYQMVQLFSMPAGSIRLPGMSFDVDINFTQHDHRGGIPTMIIP